MPKPNTQTKFLPLSAIEKFSDSQKYYCFAVVFSPATENDHFEGCPPYIAISESNNDFDSENDYYFEIPHIIAYYAKTHPVYTQQGIENNILKGERRMAERIRNLLNLK